MAETTAPRLRATIYDDDARVGTPLHILVETSPALADVARQRMVACSIKNICVTVTDSAKNCLAQIQVPLPENGVALEPVSLSFVPNRPGELGLRVKVTDHYNMILAEAEGKIVIQTEKTQAH